MASSSGADGSADGLAMLQFVPWQSAVDVGFWQELASRKLDRFRLSESEQQVSGRFTASSHAQLSSPLQVGSDGWVVSSPEAPLRAGRVAAPGTLLNTNTLDSFKQADKKELLNKAAEKVWADIVSGRAERDPSLLNRFFLLSFADLKKWDFYYWFAFPALVLPEPARSTPLRPASAVYSEAEREAMTQACLHWKQATAQSPPEDRVEDAPSGRTADVDSTSTSSQSSQATETAGGSLQFGAPFFLLHFRPDGIVRPHPLEQWSHLRGQEGKLIVVYFDPCHLDAHAGWPLRNLLAMAVVRWQAATLDILAYKETKGRPDWDCSLTATVHLPDLPAWRAPGAPCPAATGWERSLNGKLAPRKAALGPSLDPVQLATASVDLNLQLMRWRLLPSLDLERLKSTKCLLLGAGTLGCAVARNLLAWGVRDITLVDSGTVSYSNPVRQSLFTHTDCLSGGRPKAEAAAASLQAIFPGARASGIRLLIHMPGHAVGAQETPRVLADCEQLERLVQDHDAVFLLTDTRESRWLPTLLAAAHDKLAINAALGFDTYLVMRHGAGPTAESPSEDAETSSTREKEGPARLGCYFCNDVVAPLDSTAGRTLDQQCTVTRPGLAPIAGGVAVELLVSLVHHPRGLHAPADASSPGAAFPAGGTAQPLGLVPHQVRGFLAFFSQLLVTGTAFDKCTACSATVVEEYKQRGADFLLQAFNEPTFLEDLTGLTAMLRETDTLLAEWEEEDGDAPDIDDF